MKYSHLTAEVFRGKKKVQKEQGKQNKPAEVAGRDDDDAKTAVPAWGLGQWIHEPAERCSVNEDARYIEREANNSRVKRKEKITA